MEKSTETLAAEALISYYRLTRKELDAGSILQDYRSICEALSADGPVEVSQLNEEISA